jgi:hypothetical protein
MSEKVNVLPPSDPWLISPIINDDLQALVDAGLLRPRSYGPWSEWIVPGDELEPAPHAGYVVSFTPFHERCFRVPASHFMQALPHYYGVELHNVNPNSIAQVTIFAAVCEGVPRHRAPLGPMASPVPGGAVLHLHQHEEGAPHGVGRRLHASAMLRPGAAVQPCHPHLVE